MYILPTIVRRIIAFILDLILVGLVSMAISISPLNPNADKIAELEFSYQESLSDWSKRATGVEDGTEEAESLLEEYKTINEDYIYQGSKLSIFENVMIIFIICLYFVGVPLFMEGATLGKRIMKLQIVKKDGAKSGFKELMIRAVILYGLVFNILSIIGILTLDKSAFMVAYLVLSYTSYLVDLALILTTLLKQDKRGLHEILAGTKVEERN